MTKITVKVFSDSGHAWAKVKIKLLGEFGIENKISMFSYMRGDYAYLEEDSDLNLFVNTLRNYNIYYKFKETHTNKKSKIRSYTHYKYNIK